MAKYFVVNPWVQGQKAGDVFETTKPLHHSIAAHVTKVADEPEREFVTQVKKEDKPKK